MERLEMRDFVSVISVPSPALPAQVDRWTKKDNFDAELSSMKRKKKKKKKKFIKGMKIVE
jgi:hypothetical protein